MAQTRCPTMQPLVLLTALLAMAAQGLAACGGVVKSANWAGRSSGPYTTLQKDFGPYKFFRFTNNAAITKVGSSSYLDNTLNKGCYGTGTAGGGCGLYGRTGFKGGDEMTLKYTLRFGADFKFTGVGGKLPGLCSGECPTGCEQGFSASKGFTARIMFKPGGGLIIYSYTANMSTEKNCGQETTIASGLKPNTDYTVTVSVKMNTPGKADGVIKASVAGKTATLSGRVLRSSASQKVDALMWDVFMGGSKEWAAQKTEHILFKDYSVRSGSC